jgi:membrane associated rhomboid family serine protease
MFSFWVRETARVDLVLWGSFMLIVGGVQFWAEARLGGLQPLVEKYGVSFQALDQGEAWRLLTGPFIHLNFAHWGTNAALAIFIAMVAAKITRAQTAAVFLFGSALGAFTTWVVGDEFFGSYLGVSAGVMAMLGLCGGAAWRAPKNFPINFAFTLITLGLLNIYLAWIYSPAAANAAHGVGLCLGVLWGVAYQDRVLRRTCHDERLAEAQAVVVAAV